MKKIIFTVIMMVVFFVACKTTEQQAMNKNNNFALKADASKGISKNAEYQTVTDSKGNKLEMYFENEKGIVTIIFKDEMSTLQENKTASGFSYTNSDYELLGKGNDIELKKGGKIIFTREDNIVHIETKSKNGDILNLTFNNDQGTVKAYLNGGSEINLVEEKSASGIWYKNEEYELLGKGNHYQLKHNDKTLFEN